MFQAFESSDNTGLFPIAKKSPIGEIFTEYATEDPNGEIDYRLGNTTISNIIKNEKIGDKEESIAGGRHKRTTKKRNKRSKHKHSKHKRSKTNKRKQI